MFQTVCNSLTKQFQQLCSILPRMAVRGGLSRVVSVCLPVHSLFSNCPCSFQIAAVRSVTVRSVYSTTVVSSLHSFHGESACRHRSCVLHSRSLWPMTMQSLRCRSTSAAPDVFPKRMARRTKNKDTAKRSQVLNYTVP